MTTGHKAPRDKPDDDHGSARAEFRRTIAEWVDSMSTIGIGRKTPAPTTIDWQIDDQPLTRDEFDAEMRDPRLAAWLLGPLNPPGTRIATTDEIKKAEKRVDLRCPCCGRGISHGRQEFEDRRPG